MTTELNAPTEQQAANSKKLEPMLIRLPPTLAHQLRCLAQATRIRQSDYLREAVADLLAKYRHLSLETGERGDAH